MNKTVLLVVLLLLSMSTPLAIMPAYSATAAVVFVDPASIVDETKTPGGNIIVYVKIADVSASPGVAGVQFRLEWNSTILTCTSIELPTGHFMDPVGAEEAEGNLWKIYARKGTGYAEYAVTYYDITAAKGRGTVPRSGSGTLAKITLNITSIGSTGLSFIESETIIGDENAVLLDFTLQNGLFDNRPAAPPPASGTIKGKVTDTEGQPIENASVSAEGDTTSSHGSNTTDEEGNYVISSDLETDTYTVTASAAGYTSATTPGVNVIANQVTSGINFQLPKIPPVEGHDVAVINVEPASPVIYDDWAVNISVRAMNNGSFAESFTVTAYYNDSNIIAAKDVTNLLPGETVTLVFTWNTSETTQDLYTNYTIAAEASTVTDETDTTNNLFADGPVKVVIRGDRDGNGVVNILDIIAVASAFGSTPESPRWNILGDLNGDGRITVNDLILIARSFGQKWP